METGWLRSRQIWGIFRSAFIFILLLWSRVRRGVLGKESDSLYYEIAMDSASAGFLREYMTPDGRAISNTQAAYVLALYTGILPTGMRVGAVERLVALIHANRDHLGTGFLGTPYLCPILTQYGHSDLAFTLLKQTTAPSWLYPVKMGATTIWEKWDGVAPDSSINVGSFNHYAYGAIGHWLYQDVAGIGAGVPGYRRIVLHPHPGAALSAVDASYESDYGVIRSGWKTDSGRLEWQVEIPANTRAEIWFPKGAVSERGRSVTAIPGVRILPTRDDCEVIDVGSGRYFFTVGR
jgi:alpha-L-rhamnosidase